MLLVEIALLTSCAFGLKTTPVTPSRRELLLVAVGSAAPFPAAAIAPCKPNANNCWSTASQDKTKIEAWSWPSGTSKQQAITELNEAIASYPQEGQGDVDKGGWKMVSEGKYEFKSGVGNFAKFFNGGQPFVDDFQVEVGDNVQIFSSSRVGDSDFGVNAKRINYLADKLKAKGWNAPGVPAP